MKKLLILLILISAYSFIGCADTKSHSTGVYMLMDTSGTYTKQLEQAKAVINYLLGNLNAGDSFAVARIDSGSFSEKDIIAKITFAQRPSVANQQKLQFKKIIENFISTAKGSAHTDIKGGVLQAVDYLEETEAGNKHILIFSDLEEDLPKGHIRNLEKLKLENYKVIALNVTKLGSDQINPTKYYERLEYWEKIVTERGGEWKKLDDLKRLEKILEK